MTRFICTQRMPTTPPDVAMKRRGAFIVFEGPDRSGKSTQCKMLQSFLANQGQRSSLMHFPGRLPDMSLHIPSLFTQTLFVR